MLGLAIVCFIFLICIQGGFYSQSYLIVGAVCSLICVIRAKKTTLSYEVVFQMALVIIYMISTMICGMAYSTFGAAILQVVVLMIAMMLSYMELSQRERMIRWVRQICILSSMIAIIFYFAFYNNGVIVEGGRLMFTFEYANVCGLWFGAGFLLCFYSDQKATRILSICSLVALLMTKSAGTILILFVVFMVHFFRNQSLDKMTKRMRYLLFGGLLAAAVAAVLVVLSRTSSVLSTFSERLIQSLDGLKMIASHLFTGIGASNWQYVVSSNQSAQYTAKVIHNYYVQVGTDAGVLAILVMLAFLLLAIVKYIRKNRVVELVAVLILVDALIEYNLMFSSISFLFMICMMYEPVLIEKRKVEMKKVIARGVCFVCFCMILFAGYGVVQDKQMEAFATAGNLEKAEIVYQNNLSFMKNGYKENEMLGVLRCMNGYFIKDLSPQSSRLKMYEVMYSEDCTMDEIIALMESQPYNIRAYRNTKDLVDKKPFSDEEKERYRECLTRINQTFSQWPAKLLNNQRLYKG